MALATWWQPDALRALRALPGFRAAPTDDDALMSELNRIPVTEVRARRRDGHRPYIGWLEGVPVTYGWVATREASIGELDVTLRLTARDRYLWDFATLPAWQGRGLYPRLLQAILQQEAPEAERFWIIYAPENLPSGAGMRKAGFTPAAELSYDEGRRVRLSPLGEPERARAAAALLGVALVTDALAPCWHCNGEQAGQASSSACWPPKAHASACTCGIEVKKAALPTLALAPA
jgi:GNAT superfamily N-acetyltransferase